MDFSKKSIFFQIRFIFFLVWFFIFPITVKSQTFHDNSKYLAVYELIYQPDSTNTKLKRTERQRLYIGEDYSMYASEGVVIKDSILENFDRSDRTMGKIANLQKQIPNTDFDYRIYKNVPPGKITYSEIIVTDGYRYLEDKKLMKWEILSERKKIRGYEAQKAIINFRGREFTAWFTTSIPISEGPYKFYGLPGLILRIGDSKDHYVFNLLEFRILDEVLNIDFESEKFQEISKRQFLMAKENYKRDPLTSLENSGIKIILRPGQREKKLRRHLEQLKIENNPLELKNE